jgi:hypothetical protein
MIPHTVPVFSPVNSIAPSAEDPQALSLAGQEPPKPLSVEEVESILRDEVRDAIDYSDSVESPTRAKNTKYYRGDPFGNEEEGRSQVVSMDVRDTVQSFMPQLMRCFLGTEKVAEFEPEAPGKEELAEQATDYVDYIVRRQNPGFIELHSVFKDALIHGMGVIKYWAEPSVRELKRYRVSNATPEVMAVLAAEAQQDGVRRQIRTLSVNKDGSYEVEVIEREHKNLIRIAAVPPEEFLRSRQARSIDDAKLVAHRKRVTVSDLVALGYDRDDILEHASYVSTLENNPEAIQRDPNAYLWRSGDVQSADPATQKIEYIECYMRIDEDGDGIAELRKICVIGNCHILRYADSGQLADEVVAEKPFADFCPDPEPHIFGGLGLTDLVADIQRIKSAVMRNMLDSLASTILPRTVVVEGQVNLADVQNTEVGAIIRARQPGMVQPLEVPNTAEQAYPMIEYLDKVKESRTGQSAASAGLDPDALQSTTAAAVAATVSAAQQHVELIARIFAETGLKRLYRGLLRLICAVQPKQQIVRLRGKWVPITPAAWNVDMDVTVNVAVGQHTYESRINALQKVADLQGNILSQYGPNPLVSVAQYRYTLAKILELNGFKNPDKFFSDVPPDYQPPAPQQQQDQGQRQQDAQSSAAAMLAQVQAQEIQAKMQIAQQEMALKRLESDRKYQLDRDKLLADSLLQAADIEARTKAKIDTAKIEAAIRTSATQPMTPNA